jgi:hypothetical protein
MNAVSDSAFGQQPVIPPRASSLLRGFAFDALGDDLCEPVEPLGMTDATQPVSAMNAVFCFAIYASVTLKRNRELLLLGYVLESLPFIGYLAAPEEWLEHNRVTFGHGHQDLFLH